MLTTYVLYHLEFCFSKPEELLFANFWPFAIRFLLLQAIKVLNMIKLYGKPIRVNKVFA